MSAYKLNVFFLLKNLLWWHIDTAKPTLNNADKRPWVTFIGTYNNLWAIKNEENMTAAV